MKRYSWNLNQNNERGRRGEGAGEVKMKQDGS